MSKTSPDKEEEQEDGGSGQRVKKKTTKVVDKKIAHVQNVSEFVSEVLAHRKLEPQDALIQIGIDHGGHFLKYKLLLMFNINFSL